MQLSSHARDKIEEDVSCNQLIFETWESFLRNYHCNDSEDDEISRIRDCLVRSSYRLIINIEKISFGVEKFIQTFLSMSTSS